MPTTNPFDPGYYNTADLRQFGFKHVGENVKISKDTTIMGLHNISLANNIRIDGNVVIIASAGTLDLGSWIHIGAGCYIGCAGNIAMEDFSGLSQGVRIYSGTDDYSGLSLTNPTIPRKFLNTKIAPVYLKKHAIIGSGTVILPGVIIGEGSSVGALSLVTKSLDDWGVYFGCPVKKLKNRSKRLLGLEADFKKELNDASTT